MIFLMVSWGFATDLDQDGKKSFIAKLVLTESIQELINKGGKVEGVKAVRMEFIDGVLMLNVDTDQDGENSFYMQLDVNEGYDEFKKKKKES